MEFEGVKGSFKPYYKWITFNIEEKTYTKRNLFKMF